jgi:hypothetical protein
MSTQDTSTEDYAARLARIEAALALTPRSRCDDWDSDTVEWLLAQLRARDRQLAEAREVLAPLLEKPWRDIWTYSDPDATCIFCERSADIPRPVSVHEDDCPVLRKDAILGRQASERAPD